MFDMMTITQDTALKALDGFLKGLPVSVLAGLVALVVSRFAPRRFRPFAAPAAFGGVLWLMDRISDDTSGVFRSFLDAWDDRTAEGIGWLAGALFVPLVAVAALVVGRVAGRMHPSTPKRHSHFEQRGPGEQTSDQGTRLVDAMEKGANRTFDIRGSGTARKLRTVHSHGTVCAGTFEVDAGIRAQLEAPLLRGNIPPGTTPNASHPVPAIVRFSNFHPAVADSSRSDCGTGPRGLAIKLTDGRNQDLNLVTMSVPTFFAATRDDFLTFSRIFGWPSLGKAIGLIWLVATGRTRAATLVSFSRSKRMPCYGAIPYFGVNAFYWRIDGEEVPVRYKVTPVGSRQKEAQAEAKEAKRTNTDPCKNAPANDTYLHDRLDAWLADPNHTVEFDVGLVIGEGLTTEQINDPREEWPTNLACRTLGRLVVTAVIDETSDAANPGQHDSLAFDPHHLCEGIRPSDDEILMARRAAYAESHRRRT